jgi:hypothetical protein
VVSGTGSADADPQAFLGGLVNGVTRVLPPSLAASALTVDRARSLSDRLAGRPGTITRLSLAAPGETLTLEVSSGPRWTPEAQRVYGGVVISRRTLPLGEWLNAFAGRVAALAADAAGDAASASLALQKLGIQPAGSDIRVTEGNLEGDLQTLSVRLGNRVPPEAAEAVGRIAGLLVDTVPRLTDGGEPEIVVRRTATVYLPDTLRAYLSLPADWATDHVFPDGSTPAQALTAQLILLEAAVKKMRDAAVEQDASALLVNGRFLSERFTVSSLDLP